MNRNQLDHVVPAACEITGDPGILVIGSQSILGTYDEDLLPDAATASMEADVAFLDAAVDAKADTVDGAIGELSPFHESYAVTTRASPSESSSCPRTLTRGRSRVSATGYGNGSRTRG